MKISPARMAAFEILYKIETEKAFSAVLLPIYEETLSPSDRGLCHELTLGVLRRQIYLDRIIDQFSKGKKLDTAVRISLRIGLYQLLFLDKVPAYSAINESVELIVRAKKSSAKGFVNAILRRATREQISLSFSDDIERVSVETSHPRWLVEKWAAEWGDEITEKLAAANNDIPKTTFRFTAKADNKKANKPTKWKESDYVEECFTSSDVDIDLRERAEGGEVYFQDEASQMVAGAVEFREGGRFLDVCAAPGGKTGQIASKHGQGALGLIVAGDLYWPRVEFLRENCRRQGVDFINIVQYDAETSLPFAEEFFDSVLVDATCSGTGTIRHNPEIRYSLSPNDFAVLSGKQLAKLTHASKLVIRGGKLIYSTCSMEREENEAVIERFLDENSEFRAVAPKVHERFLTEDGFARTFPHRDGMDGFFIAALERQSELK